MERLNDIIGKAIPRRQLPDPRIQQENTHPGTAQQQASRRPLPEQTARPGQRVPYSNVPQSQYPSTRSRPPQDADETIIQGRNEGRPHGFPPSPPNTRPFYQRQQRSPLNSAPGYPPRSRPRMPEEKPYEPQYPLPATRMTRDYNAYPPTLPADVVDEWEEEGGMVYGDWERDGDEVLIYQRTNAEVVPAQPPYYAPEPQDRTDQITQARVTRDLRMPIAKPPSIPARTQNTQHISRVTQPLDLRAVPQVSHGHEIAQEQHKIRQFVPQEQRLPTPPALAKGICSRCRGAGYLRIDVPFGHPNFGKPIACVCKEAERKERRRQQLRDMSNLDAFRSQSFRTFNARIPGVQEAYATSLEYAQNPDGWMLLVGPNGCGKTHLAAAIANQCLDSGSVVLFSVVPDLLDHLRAAFAPDAKEIYDQLFSKMRESEVLVLDDLGAQQSSPWANEKLFQLLNYRYNMSMPTVITANPRGLQGIDERIRSRIMDTGLVYTIALDRAGDYRRSRPRKE